MPSDLGDVFSFVARLQRGPENRTAYVGTKVAEIADTFEEFKPQPIVRQSEADVVAAAFVDYDEELRRVWLWGPWIESDQWQTVADELWDRIVEVAPKDAQEIELAWATENHNVAEFARRYGFEQFSDGYLMTFTRPSLQKLPEVEDVLELPSHLNDPVAEMHDSLFPRLWPNGRQMIERLSEGRRVFVLTDNDGLLGYVHAEVKPELGEGIIEFLGVVERVRGQGLGKRLIAAALKWIFSFESIEEIELFVRKDNPAAAKLYAGIGFEQVVRLIGARKPLG